VCCLITWKIDILIGFNGIFSCCSRVLCETAVVVASLSLGSPVDEIKQVLSVPGVKYHINADSQGQIQCITWTSDEQLLLLHQYPDVIMMDGTYKVGVVCASN